VAQLVACLVRNEKVTGSIPVRSTEQDSNSVMDAKVEVNVEPSHTTRYRRGFRVWLWAVGIAVLAAFALPYLVVPLIPSVFATYLFWTGFSAVIVVLVLWGVSRWRDE
jgi:high-affinity Fe2+/Pb2+ permease